MQSDRELMQQALEALEPDWELAEWYVEELQNKAITALRERLAQPEREPCREWVGLTEEEAFACRGRDYFETYRAIEAKLKQRNT